MLNPLTGMFIAELVENEAFGFDARKAFKCSAWIDAGLRVTQKMRPARRALAPNNVISFPASRAKLATPHKWPREVSAS